VGPARPLGSYNVDFASRPGVRLVLLRCQIRVGTHPGASRLNVEAFCSYSYRCAYITTLGLRIASRSSGDAFLLLVGSFTANGNKKSYSFCAHSWYREQP